MKEAIVVQDFDFSKMVMAIQGRAFTTSQKIADYFRKSHKNVLRKSGRQLTNVLMISPGSILSLLISLIKMVIHNPCSS